MVRSDNRPSSAPNPSADPPALPRPLRGPVAIVAILAALVLTLLAVRYAGGDAPDRLDIWAKTTVDSLLPEPGLGTLVVDFVGEPLGVVLIVAVLTVLCLALGRWRLAIVVVAGLGVAGVVTLGLKPLVGRTIHGEFLAFPSGHTATATIFALVVMLLVVDLLQISGRPAVLLIMTGAGVAGMGMALSQIALGAHYPTDTIGGFCAALFVVSTTAYLADRLPSWRPTRNGRAGG